MIKIGIIGGSGLDDPKILKDSKQIEVKTEYGDPSSPLTLGKINDTEVVLIARHGLRHTITPTNVNYRANIQALKSQGVTHIIATTACGSLRKEIDRGHFVILDQFIDFTRHRKVSYFDNFECGVKHTPMADPFSEQLREILINTAESLEIDFHKKGTVITIEGPRFSTRAESKMFRQWGADVINMSVASECILANEAEIPYAAVAMSTDYDSWLEGEEPVTWDDILKVFEKNVEKVIKLLTTAIPQIKDTK